MSEENSYHYTESSVGLSFAQSIQTEQVKRSMKSSMYVPKQVVDLPISKKKTLDESPIEDDLDLDAREI